MATVVGTNITGLTEAMLRERVNSIDVGGFAFGRHFPLRRVYGFNWRSIGVGEDHRVAADVHADGSSIIRKRRPITDVAHGDIPFISISRQMSRTEMKEYQSAQACAGVQGDASNMVQYWGQDVDFVFNGVQNELEYIAWQLVGNAGRVSFTADNNATWAAEYDMDYQVDADARQVVSWGGVEADILGGLAEQMQANTATGWSHVFMSLPMFYRFMGNKGIKKALALANLRPDMDGVNALLSMQPWLNGAIIHVVANRITREKQDGTRTTEWAFPDNRVVLAPSDILGSTQYDVLAETSPAILYANRAHTVVKRYGTVEPTSEVTIGQADAVPVFDAAYSCRYLRTDGQAWE